MLVVVSYTTFSPLYLHIETCLLRENYCSTENNGILRNTLDMIISFIQYSLALKAGLIFV